ncbi:unnamed protein product [Gordionus sp. m RMFG-2023]
MARSLALITRMLSIWKGANLCKYSSHGSHGGPPEFHIHIPAYSMNDMEVPSKPYKPTVDKMNTRWNLQLAGATIFFLATCIYCYKIDIFWTHLHPRMKNPPAEILTTIAPPIPADQEI